MKTALQQLIADLSLVKNLAIDLTPYLELEKKQIQDAHQAGLDDDDFFNHTGKESENYYLKTFEQ